MTEDIETPETPAQKARKAADEARVQAQLAENRARKIQADVEREAHRQAAELERRLNREGFAAVKEEYDAAVAEAKALRDKADDLAIEAALVTDGALPVGARVERMKSWGYGSRTTWYGTGVFGVVEVVTRETEFADNVQCRPNVGSKIVRYLRKDGTPSKRVDKRLWSDHWRVVKPEQA